MHEWIGDQECEFKHWGKLPSRCLSKVLSLKVKNIKDFSIHEGVHPLWKELAHNKFTQG